MTRDRPAGLRSVSLFSPQARGVLSSSSLRLSGSSPAAASCTEDTANGGTSDRIEVSGSVAEEVRGATAECNSCHVTFADRAEQVAHYRLDWHRYNLKRRLRGFPHVTQAKFEEEAGDLSSISGSESDSEDSCEATPTDSAHQSTSSPFVYFTADGSDTGTVYSVYRVILTGGKEYVSNERLVPSLLSLSLPPCWVVLMRAGGHFAGAVFKGSSVVAHKTFHRYTVRAKSGTSQSLRDNQSGGHGPKSAGASLRRYNESALEREVQELLQSWASHLRESTAIFIRAPRTHMTTFTGGKTPLVSRDDPRVRGIPFSTRRPTFKEVKRVHACLASVYYHDNVSKKAVNVETVSPATLNKSEPNVEATNDTNCEEVRVEREEEEVGGESGDCGDDDSGEGGTQGGGEGKRKRRRKKKVEKSWKDLSLSPFLAQLLTGCELGGGEEEMMMSVLQNLNISSITEATPTTNELSGQTSGQASSSGVLNQLYGGVSPLHVASEHGHPRLVQLLLEHGADPCLRDSSGRVPYLVSRDKSVRDSYRRFMGQWPQLHDYSQTQIPSPLTDDMERQRREKAAEKKREKKKQAKKKKSEEKAREEEAVVARRQGETVQGLSEREKRALAAERRLAAHNSADSLVQRAGVCSCCGRGIAGVVPFHRLQYHYCSMPCVREHRTRLENS